MFLRTGVGSLLIGFCVICFTQENTTIHTDRFVGGRQQTIVRSHTAIATNLSMYAGQPDSLSNKAINLDLSVPFNPADEHKMHAVIGETPGGHQMRQDLFSPATHPMATRMRLEGHWIMSQEPEAGKSRSAEGAGFVILLQH